MVGKGRLEVINYCVIEQFAIKVESPDGSGYISETVRKHFAKKLVYNNNMDRCALVFHFL
jgi:hypothetical protein